MYAVTNFKKDFNYDDPDHHPFADRFRKRRDFRFFHPTEEDIAPALGIILNSGRSTLSDDMKRIRFAIATFNSGKATPAIGLPDDNPIYISRTIAQSHNLKSDDKVRVRNVQTGSTIILRVIVSDRVKGQSCYVSFHKTRAEIEQNQYINTVTGHVGRCPYTAQSNFKLTAIELERVEED